MASQLQASSKLENSSSLNHIKLNENRPLANFPPSLWGDLFLTLPEMKHDDAADQLRDELKQEIGRMLAKPMQKTSQKLQLVDAVQRLGVGYHFEKEIEDALQIVYEDYYNNNDHEGDDDLYITSLRFRLLREHGFTVHCESFNKFKDEKGNFKASLTRDVRGLIELYEAAYLRVHGETLLEEALVFTNSHLKLAEKIVEYPLSALVAHARNSPIRRTLPRLESRRYIPIYEASAHLHQNLLHFSKLDFNFLQQMHKKEMSEIYRWWKGLEFSNKLPFVRERVVEDYFWALGIYFEPQFSVARMWAAKVIVIVSAIDDIYDAYGTFEELELFTTAIQRWDMSCMDQLPDYMKI